MGDYSMFHYLFGSWFVVAVLAFLLITSIWWYLLPAWIASRRMSNDKRAILFVNLIFGWTVIGWFISLAWALHETDRRLPGEHTKFYLFPR